MHNDILFISTEPADIEISTSFMAPDDIGMVGIADYIGDKISIPETIAGVKVNTDGSCIRRIRLCGLPRNTQGIVCSSGTDILSITAACAYVI